MKTWKKPEVKIFDVKMDENIAASGDGGYRTSYIYYDLGGITRGGANYRWNGNNNIQDTGVQFTTRNGESVVPNNKVSTISGCMA